MPQPTVHLRDALNTRMPYDRAPRTVDAMLSPVEAVWNRALELPTPAAASHPGDAALLIVLTFHGLVTNGGLFNAVELHGHDDVYPIDAVVEAYHALGLEDAAGAIDNAALEERDIDDDDDEARRDAERRIDATYTVDEATIESALAAQLRESPGAFAPLT